MFARKVSLQLKPHSIAAVTRTIEQDIMPLLHTQPGFQAEIAFVVPGVTEAVRVRGYPETLSPCCSDIKQHSCGNETQDGHKERAYSA